MNGMAIPAVWLFVVAQASAAIWWASGTDQQVEKNTSVIEQVVDNEKQIAVMQVQQTEIQKDVSEVRATVNDIYRIVNRWSGDE